MIRIVDIAWAAGFLEGEGSFLAQTPNNPKVTCPQVQREPLQRLQQLFGGKLHTRKAAYRETRKTITLWVLCGQPAIRLMMTIYCLMSKARKKKIAKVI